MELKVKKSLKSLLMSDSCPDEQDLAAYADRQLVGAERHHIEHHISNCDTCAGQVAFLVRTSEEVGGQIPDELLASAMRMGRPEAKQNKPNWRLIGAGAFVLIVAIFLSFDYPKDRKSSGPKPAINTPNLVAQNHPNSNPAETPIQSHELRGNEVSMSPFLFPVPNQTVDVKNLVFRWKEFAHAESYEIELLTDDGTYVWAQQVRTDSVALPRSVKLSKGQTYFIKLRIQDTRGTVEQTKAVGFIAD